MCFMKYNLGAYMFWLFSFLIGFSSAAHADPPVMMQEQRIQKGWLGVRFQERDAFSSKNLGFDAPLIEVDLVVQDSPASHYGVEAGDVYSHIDGVRVDTKEKFIAQIQSKNAGDVATLHRVLHKGSKVDEDVRVMLGARPAERELQRNMFLGQPAKSFTYVDFDTREEINFTPEPGSVVLLDFWATWCGPCLMMMPHFRQLHEKYAEKGLKIIGITDEPEAKIRPIARRFKIPYGLGSNRSYDAFRMYSVQALPTAYLIDDKGIIQDVFIGGGHIQKLENRIVELLDK
ncbi:MAG: hypothetical protein CL916_15020 [Deltaproteobacteria bacterium]|nr:hypothetical protein [Deltaproteobacteria bacterium]